VVTARTGIEMIKASPWVGLGPEIVGRDFHRYVPPDIPMPLPDGFYGHLHNVYLQYGADRGLPTLAMFLWFVGAGLAHMIRTVRSFPAVAHGSLAAMIGILTEGFFEFNLNDSEVLSMFLIVVVCSFLVTKQEATPL
ncbi:MAG TPA: O-antigen ligase family protein, partial [Bryobacteraceae bacterium]|nr:O-antigen ligase family protein [Bryobacteraceae bacterium]